MLYIATAAYEQAAERGLHPLDPRVAIAWPLAVEQLSERDASHPALPLDFDGIEI